MPQSQEIYSTIEFNSNNIHYYTVSAQIQRKEEQQMNELMDLYCPEIDLDDILVSTEEYLSIKTK